MLANLRIRGYPPFEDLEMPACRLPRPRGSLGLINLITGYNGVGKTALLRAIHLLSGSLTVDVEGTVGLSTEMDGHSVSLSCRLTAPFGSPVSETPQHRTTPCKYNAGESWGHPAPAPVPVVCVFPDRNDEPENARRLAQLSDADRGELIEALRLFEPTLRSLQGAGTAIVCDKGLAASMPLGLMGTGMGHAARLLLAVMTAKNGLVLVDEVESSLHHKQMEALWRILCDRASRDHVQIFATSHSLECMRAAVAAHAAMLTGRPGIRQKPILVHRIDNITHSRAPKRGRVCTTYHPDLLDHGLKFWSEWR